MDGTTAALQRDFHQPLCRWPADSTPSLTMVPTKPAWSTCATMARVPRCMGIHNRLAQRTSISNAHNAWPALHFNDCFRTRCEDKRIWTIGRPATGAQQDSEAVFKTGAVAQVAATKPGLIPLLDDAPEADSLWPRGYDRCVNEARISSGLLAVRKWDNAVYNQIFFTNVLWLLDEHQMSKKDLSDRSGVSLSFLSDLTTGKANPSLKVMEDIAAALDTPLPLLLESTDLDEESLQALAEGKPTSSLPPGYERVSAILPEHQAFIVRKWHEAARIKRGPKS